MADKQAADAQHQLLASQVRVGDKISAGSSTCY